MQVHPNLLLQNMFRSNKDLSRLVVLEEVCLLSQDKRIDNPGHCYVNKSESICHSEDSAVLSLMNTLYIMTHYFK